ncbi:MAG: 1-(5-phosphoribosyl)-5-[(5-phosphoribosylamino)methylideneamino]imidazole-4-carboxamide isomerase [Elusimicrobiota bacterium]|nr:1-(5-phosphoribosyl)-5-[(5-phosphoribosylamino)methylideneamino]imidazole-4-carboxamide isomerase [Endomicrobiia bacterium]MDW8166211.1 1-(5-phosphoribosyl)-5-[(5-phosphoribosylamino)methylideneamino]imidazole-4-carboxamide isomerase [Elusimicrobiota bacterium]
MIIIPAVDLHKGKCVRLTQGKLDKETIYSNDPVFVAKLWQSKGAKLLHLIDLDGAYTGCVQHWDIIEAIRKSLTIPIEFGGGVRSVKVVDKLHKIGIDKIIISTILFSKPEEAKKIINKYKEKIIIAVDLYEENKIGIGGWKEQVPLDLEEFLNKISSLGIKEIIVTDIQKEGMLEGVDISKIEKLIEKTSKFDLKVIISGGVTTIEDIKNIKKFEKDGVVGIIIGKGLYSEKISFEEALKVVQL